MRVVPRFLLVLLAGLALVFGRQPAQAEQSPATEMDPALYLPMLSNNNPPSVADCPVFPADNAWNTPVDRLPVDAHSAEYINSIGVSAYAHADFGSGTWEGGPIGIPYVLVPGTQPKVSVTFAYAGESDPGPYPIPANAPIEGGPGSDGDRHVLVIDQDACRLYELYAAYRQSNGTWTAGSGAIFDLRSHALRPTGWTSADAAGLPIFPGLARYEEAARGEIRHALRFTAPRTQNAYTWPARHKAGTACSTCPPMGQRFRLKAGFNIGSAPVQVQVLLRAMKRYGMILADNGSSWYISGAPDERWNNDALHWLDDNLPGSAFEAVDTSSLMIDPNSGQARQP